MDEGQGPPAGHGRHRHRRGRRCGGRGRVRPRQGHRRTVAGHALPPKIATDIRNAADIATARHLKHLVDRAEAAYGAYERGRFQDALRAIKPVADEAPGVLAVRESPGSPPTAAGAGAPPPATWRRSAA